MLLGAHQKKEQLAGTAWGNHFLTEGVIKHHAYTKVIPLFVFYSENALPFLQASQGYGLIRKVFIARMPRCIYPALNNDFVTSHCSATQESSFLV